jgi:hypothetical protein
MANFTGVPTGYLDFEQQQYNRARQAMIDQAFQAEALRASQTYQRQQQARQDLGVQLYSQFAKPPVQPTAPGQASVPSAPQGTPAQGNPAMNGAIGGWQTMPRPPSGMMSPGPAGQVARPPGEQKAQAPTMEFTSNLRQMIQGMHASGVPPEKVMDMLDEIQPLMSAQNKTELDQYRAQNSILTAALRAAQQEAKLQETKRHDTETENLRSTEIESRDRTRTERNKIERSKLSAKLGTKSGGIVKWDNDDDGNVIGGWDRAGHYHKIDESGAPSKTEKTRKSDRQALLSELSKLQNDPSQTQQDKSRIVSIKKQLADWDKKDAGEKKKKSSDLEQQALDAIRAGKDEEAVKARYKELTGEDLQT